MRENRSLLKRFTSLAGPLLILAILAACSGETPFQPVLASATPTIAGQAATATLQPTATPDVTTGTVIIWHSLNDPDITTLVEIIADFQNQYPDSKFDVLYMPENIILERYKIALKEGTGPSILLGPASWAPELAEGGLVLDLSSRLSAELVQRLNVGALESGKAGAFQAGMPYSLDGVVLYRNQEIIPDAPQTWDDLVSQAQSVPEGEQIGAFLDRGFYYSGANLEALGGLLMNADGKPAFNSEEGLEWVSLLQAYENAGPTDFLTELDIERFQLGQVGFIIAQSDIREALADQLGSQNLEIDPWPAYADTHLAGYLTSDLIYLNSLGSPETKELAWMFTEHMLSAESQARLGLIGRIPSVLDAPVEAPLIKQAVAALAGNYPYPADPNMELYRTALDTALQAIFSGAASPETALQDAANIIEEALTGAQATPSP
jgi:ABC-type glycerol-3-phosphate transport system substrate-binding protein